MSLAVLLDGLVRLGGKEVIQRPGMDGRLVLAQWTGADSGPWAVQVRRQTGGY